MVLILFLFILKLFFESAFNQIDGGSGKVVTKGKVIFLSFYVCKEVQLYKESIIQ